MNKMKREIKFRALYTNPQIKKSKMVYGDCVYQRYINSGMDGYAIETHDSEDGGFTAYRVNEETIGQYTGLKDKNGKEIYEGDIVKAKNLGFRGNKLVSNTKRIVEWGDGRWQIVRAISGNSLTSIEVIGHEIKIIGNIYENANLLNDNE